MCENKLTLSGFKKKSENKKAKHSEDHKTDMSANRALPPLLLLLHLLLGVVPQARHPDVGHLGGVGHQVQALIHLAVDDGKRTVLRNLLVNPAGAKGLRVSARPHLQFRV